MLSILDFLFRILVFRIFFGLLCLRGVYFIVFPSVIAYPAGLLYIFLGGEGEYKYIKKVELF